ncbi:MAG: GLPGLI family protein, partial [Lentimicrobium sp.]|nr:GLPGLI family protein [Lentimicrobium sp.]
MKKIMTLCAALMVALSAMAQSGSVVYTETMKLDIHIDGMGADMAEMLPKERKVSRVLHYTPDACIYLNSENIDEQEVTEEMAGGGTMVFKMQEPNEQRYFDIKNQKVIEQRDFMSRMFLIESPVDSIPWKLTGNRRNILGFQCIEAVYQKDTIITVAWFSPEISVPAGPGKYYGLPGMVLEVNIDDGKQLISAISVTEGDVASLIVKPKQGKKVSRAEFDKIVEEKTGEVQGGGGATFVI